MQYLSRVLDGMPASVAIGMARMQTERALRQATFERYRAKRLQNENRVLRHTVIELTHAAEHDALTGVANRRRFDDRLLVAQVCARHQGRRLFLALIDVDHFKHVNDHHGHPLGDAVLRRLAQVLASQCRAGDLVARVGGEEFAVLFGSDGPARARAACERMRCAVQAHNWSALAPGLTLTVSIGMGDLAAHAHVAQALKATDALLYRAKHGGRNQVVTDVAER